MDLALPAAERRVAGHCPAPRVVVVRERPADLVEPSEHLGWLSRIDVQHPDVVDRALGSAFRTGAVVRDHADDGVVELSPFPQESQDAAYLLVRMRQEASKTFHEAGGDRPVPAAQGIPGRHPGRPRRQDGGRREQAERELAGKDPVAPGVPAEVEPAAISLEPAARWLVRGVAGAGGEVQEERLGCVDRPQVGQELDRAIREIRGQVIAVLDRSGRPDAVVVVIERGHELARLAPMKAVPAVEPARQWPGRSRRGHVRLVLGRQVPLADGVGGVASGPQDLRQVAVLAWRLAPVTRIANGQVGHPAHPAAVMVAAGQQAGPRGGAQRRGVEVREPDPARGQTVDHRRLDVRAVAAELGVADIIEHDQEHVRGAGRWCRLSGPPRLRVSPVRPDPPAEILRH